MQSSHEGGRLVITPCLVPASLRWWFMPSFSRWNRLDLPSICSFEESYYTGQTVTHRPQTSCLNPGLRFWTTRRGGPDVGTGVASSKNGCFRSRVSLRPTFTALLYYSVCEWCHHGVCVCVWITDKLLKTAVVPLWCRFMAVFLAKIHVFQLSKYITNIVLSSWHMR